MAYFTLPIEVAYQDWLIVAKQCFNSEKFMRATINLAAEVTAADLELADVLGHKLAKEALDDCQLLYRSVCQSAVAHNLRSNTNGQLRTIIDVAYTTVYDSVPESDRSPQRQYPNLRSEQDPAIARILEDCRLGYLVWDAREPKLGCELTNLANPYDWYIFYNYQRTLNSLVLMLKKCGTARSAMNFICVQLEKLNPHEIEKLGHRLGHYRFISLIKEVEKTRLPQINHDLAGEVVRLADALIEKLKLGKRAADDDKSQGLYGVFGLIRYDSSQMLLACLQYATEIIKQLIDLLQMHQGCLQESFKLGFVAPGAKTLADELARYRL